MDNKLYELQLVHVSASPWGLPALLTPYASKQYRVHVMLKYNVHNKVYLLHVLLRKQQKGLTIHFILYSIKKQLIVQAP